MLKISVVYDNRSSREGLLADWGFSCIVSSEETTLAFDTGAKEEIVTKNCISLGISPASIDGVFLSHNHFDHAGGLCGFLRPSLRCFVPASAKAKIGPTIASRGGVPLYVEKREKIAPHFWSTGVLRKRIWGISEQSLVIEHGSELILITGCAHPGIVTITEQVCRDFGRPPSMIIGGFHFFKTPLAKVAVYIERLRNLGVNRIAPCHCTGNEAIEFIRQVWGPGFDAPTVGWTCCFS